MNEPQVWTLIGVFSAALFGMITLVSTSFTRAIAGLRNEMSAEFGCVRAEFGSVRAEFESVRREMTAEFGAARSESNGLRNEIRAEIDGLRTEINGLDRRIETLNSDVDALMKHTFGIPRG